MNFKRPCLERGLSGCWWEEAARQLCLSGPPFCRLGDPKSLRQQPHLPAPPHSCMLVLLQAKFFQASHWLLLFPLSQPWSRGRWGLNAPRTTLNLFGGLNAPKPGLSTWQASRLQNCLNSFKGRNASTTTFALSRERLAPRTAVFKATRVSSKDVFFVVWRQCGQRIAVLWRFFGSRHASHSSSIISNAFGWNACSLISFFSV